MNYKDIKIGKYKHYKGNTYDLIGVVRHTETKEELVIYKSEMHNEDNVIWARPLRMFLEEAPKNEKNITNQRFRFEFID